MRSCLMFSVLLVSGLFHACAVANPLVYEGESGPGVGKHIVFLAGDHEYRSEETLPALARVLAKHHGFRCTVLFTLDPETGEILPGSNHMPGTEALKTADLMVIFLRFQDFPVEQMQHIEDYLNRGGPVVGLRTSTHAFNIQPGKPYSRFDYRFKGDNFSGGFGRQILGETWAGHYGKNHVMSTRLDLLPQAASHPILRGVTNPWVQSGGYWTEPIEGVEVLALAQPLQGMTIDSPKAEDKDPCPGFWTRNYVTGSGKAARVATTTYGASVDLLNEDYCRMLVNSCFWAAGLENQITSEMNVDLVGPYHPTKFQFNGHRLQVKPLDLAGWESPIFSPEKPVGPGRKRK